ncbi:hypothetical protein TYM08_P3675 [Marinicellulosiphila megalodicopiae]
MISPLKNKPISYLKKNISTFLENAAGSNRSEIQCWLEDECVLNKFHKNLKKSKKFIL